MGGRLLVGGCAPMVGAPGLLRCLLPLVAAKGWSSHVHDGLCSDYPWRIRGLLCWRARSHQILLHAASTSWGTRVASSRALACSCRRAMCALSGVTAPNFSSTFRFVALKALVIICARSKGSPIQCMFGWPQGAFHKQFTETERGEERKKERKRRFTSSFGFLLGLRSTYGT